MTCEPQGWPTNGRPDHLGRVVTVTWRGQTEVATVVAEGIRGQLVYPETTGNPIPTNSGFTPSEQYLIIFFPDTGDTLEVPVEWMPPKGEAPDGR